MRTKPALLPLLIAACISTAPALHAQTHFYLGQIGVSPAQPTDQDEVRLLLTGSLSDTGVIVEVDSVAVNGFTIDLMVNAHSNGGLTVVLPHTDTVDVGLLAAGTYTVAVAGSGVLDLAPPAEHSFTVSGGTATACDSLIIASVEWAPFSDTALLVHVFNPTSELFDYPSFILLDANGDTLSREAVAYFGIAAESWHTLALRPGAVIPDGPFTGTLELWTFFEQQLACSWSQTFDLCPPAPCAPLSPMVQNTGGGLALGTFHYTIRAGGDPVATGEFTLTADTQYASDSICLPPGNYLMEMTADQAPGGQVWFGVGLEGAVQGPTAPLVVTTLSAVPFTFYAPCTGILGIADHPAAALRVARGPGTASVSRTDGAPLGELQLHDAQGRLIASLNERTGRHDFRTAGLAPGLYVLRAIGTDRHVLTVRWVVD